MLIVVYLLVALLAGVFVGFKVCQFYSEKKDIEELAGDSSYHRLAEIKYMTHYLLAMVPLDKPDARPRWYRHKHAPPAGHKYLRTVFVNGEIVLRPIAKLVQNLVKAS